MQPGCKISGSDYVMMQLPKLLLTSPLEIENGILWIRDFFTCRCFGQVGCLPIL